MPDASPGAVGSYRHSRVGGLGVGCKVGGGLCVLMAEHAVAHRGDGGGLLQGDDRQPALASLNAVKNGRVMTVLDDVWMAGIGYRAAELIFQDIAKFFKV